MRAGGATRPAGRRARAPGRLPRAQEDGLRQQLCPVAAWAIVTGIFEIVAAVRLRREIEGEWTLALAGVLSMLFGLGLVAAPGAWMLAVIRLIGAYAIAFGASLLALALRPRGWSRSIRVAET